MYVQSWSPIPIPEDSTPSSLLLSLPCTLGHRAGIRVCQVLVLALFAVLRNHSRQLTLSAHAKSGTDLPFRKSQIHFTSSLCL